MKYLLYFSALLFITSSCKNPDFADVAGSTSEDQQTEQPSVTEAKKELKVLVQKDIKKESKKIRGKKQQSVDVEHVVGEKKLDKKKLKGNKIIIQQNINIGEGFDVEVQSDTDKKVSVVKKKSKDKEKTETTDKEKTIVEIKQPEAKKKMSKKKKKYHKKRAKTNIEIRLTDSDEEMVPKSKVDLVFYMQTRDSSCVNNLRSFSEEKGFLSRLKGLDWQVSLSYYFQNESALLPLEIRNGHPHNIGKLFSPKRDYALSRGEYSLEETNRLFHNTLKVVSPSYNDRGDYISEETTSNSNGNVEDPLVGLDYILSKKPEDTIRSGSDVIVLLFGYDFPYYSSKIWKAFFKKHTNVNIIVTSSRLANVSNFLHILEKNDRFTFMPICETKKSPKNLVKVIKNIVD